MKNLVHYIGRFKIDKGSIDRGDTTPLQRARTAKDEIIAMIMQPIIKRIKVIKTEDIINEIYESEPIYIMNKNELHTYLKEFNELGYQEKIDFINFIKSK